MGEPVVWIGGEKGGVGKSLLAQVSVDYLVASGRKVLLIDTDTAADVYKAYKDIVPSEVVNIKEREEWIRLAQLISDHPDSIVVINTMAGCHLHVEESGGILTKAVKRLDRKLLALWVLDRKRDSLEFLVKFMEAVPEAEMVVVRNLYAGTEKKFELYNSSNTKKALEKKGAKTINFPEVADRVTDAMNRDRLTIEKALKELPFGDRMEVERWRDECKAVMTQVYG